MTSHSRLVAAPYPFSSSQSCNTEQEQPHLSGSLVKQLSSSPSTARSRAQHLDTMSSATTPLDHHQQQPRQEQEQAPVLKPQAKKQVRRRMHTSRPYQERLLNMAEARREIVAALRVHRANMRHQSRDRQEQLQPPFLQQQQVQVVLQEQNQAVEGVPVAMSYASFSNHLCSSPLAHLVASAPTGSYSSSMLSYDLTPLEAPAAIGGLEHLVCSLPAQPLGLNLSFQDFGGSLDDAKNSDYLFGVPLIPSSSPPASSYSAYSSPVVVTASTHGLPAFSTAENASPVGAPAALSPVVDGREMQSIGGRHGMEVEWSEAAAANVAAASAWWSKIVESGGAGEIAVAARVDQGAAVGMVDDGVAAGLPECLCDGVGEQGVTGIKPDALEMHVDDGDYNCCYEGDRSDDGDDIALPCMDIGDIEGWDGEWFS